MEVKESFHIDRNGSHQMINLVRQANQFQSYIVLETNNKVVNCKSLISISAFLVPSENITLKAVGDDAKEAVTALQRLFK
ncbi:HPr family phosphocarrier protein [Alteribacillus sp. YIM 98480]|uniref:HPr family phosphocarrier protein n=1 Tax=Alteribacillus sp. YIM 98480 TaxID=2606599 RepID=UPI00131E405E|nr:HPr family phosphocarrier protein [Alteribacillus sp. YIM 98480]